MLEFNNERDKTELEHYGFIDRGSEYWMETEDCKGNKVIYFISKFDDKLWMAIDGLMYPIPLNSVLYDLINDGLLKKGKDE